MFMISKKLKKIMKNRFILLLFLFLCYGCSSSFLIDEDNHIADGQICFSTNRLSAYSLVSTKATQVVLNDLYDGFNVSCVKGTPGSDVSVWGSTAFSKVGNVFTGGRWWPDSDESYRFYAVYPSTYAITFNAGGSTITASSADDVVVAYCSSSVFGEVNELQFEHIFARLGNVTVQGFDGYDITNVSITVIPYISGTYNMRTGEWAGKTAGSSTIIAESVGSNSNDRYMVPGGYKFKATWTATHDSYSETFSAVSTRVSLSAGYVNNFTIKLGGNGPEVRVDVSLSDWEATALNAGYFPVKWEGLRLDVLTDGYIGFYHNFEYTSMYRTIEYSKDFGNTWTSLNSSNQYASYPKFSVSAGDVIYLKGNNEKMGYGSEYGVMILGSNGATYNASGNPKSLTGGNFNDSAFCYLFGGGGCVDASGLVLDSDVLTEYCYACMFSGCTTLTVPPSLPANTLATGCYYSMFSYCTSLTTAPVLPASDLVSYCYLVMFYNCSSLNYVKALFTTTPSTSYTESWLGGVSASGVFVKADDASWNVSGTYGIPSGWSVYTESTEP